MKITKIKVGLGNTCGPTYQPIKCNMEYEAELDADEDPTKAAELLRNLAAVNVWNYCLEQLASLKGSEEAAKFKMERSKHAVSR